MATYVEAGDIYFFYRPKVNVEKVQGLDDVQRLHMVLAPDDEDTARLFVVGKKRMPKITQGKPTSTAREWPTEALEAGKLAEPQMKPETREPAGDRRKGGERGGKVARNTSSAAGIVQALKGVDFPCGKADLIKQARANHAADEVIEVLNEFPRRQYQTMADIQKAVGEVR